MCNFECPSIAIFNVLQSAIINTPFKLELARGLSLNAFSLVLYFQPLKHKKGENFIVFLDTANLLFLLPYILVIITSLDTTVHFAVIV